MVGLGILGASGKTPFAYIGQRGLEMFNEHPWLEIRALIADDPADVGKTLAEATQRRWFLDTPVPERWAEVKLVGLDKQTLDSLGVELVLSGLPGPLARELDPQLAEMGFGVVSESMGLRHDPDVPLVVPEVNADHLQLIADQRAARGYDRGFLVATPLCTAVIAALAVKPIVDAFGIESAVYTTLQALSGAGPTGVPALRVIDNVLPYISDEEEKLRSELIKILGTYKEGRILPHPAPLAATCTRVPVRDGHTISATLACEREVSVEGAIGALATYRGRTHEFGLPSAPTMPVVVRSEPDRPQPLLDRDLDRGRAITVGRVRSADAFPNGLSFVAVGHNHDRGTVGNAVITCELVVAEQLVGR